MGMFDNYTNLNPDYIPNNTFDNEDIKYICDKDILPHKLYNVKKNFTGYQWNNTDRFNWTISVDKNIRVAKDAIIYEKSGEAPDIRTVGTRLGQHAYNIQDAKSWTFCGRTETIYMWVEDDYIIYPVNGTKHITINTNMEDKYIKVTIFNFRWESIFESIGNIGESELSIDINDSVANILTPGVYYVTVEICGDTESKLDNKYMIAIS